MKRSFQIQKVTVPANSTKVVMLQLRETYKRCTGVFAVPETAGVDLSPISLNCKIAQNEVLPTGTDLVFLTFNGNSALKDVIYDFTKDNIPAKSSDAELEFKNKSANALTFNFYFVLEND